MYHTLKNKDKEVKPPKGWQFSGDSSFLKLTNSDFSVYFMVVNSRVRVAVQTGFLPTKKKDEWEVEEHHGQTEVKINHGKDLTEKEAKEIAVELAKTLNKERVMDKFKWIIVPVLLGALLGALVTFILGK